MKPSKKYTNSHIKKILELIITIDNYINNGTKIFFALKHSSRMVKPYGIPQVIP